MVDSKEKFAGLFGLGSDDSFNDPENILSVDPDDLIPFDQHLFDPYDDSTMEDLVRSIEDVGQLSPVLVREHPTKQGKYEILAGHNRTEACRRLEQNVFIYVYPDDLTDEQAKLIVIESNIKQRTLSALSPSKQAKIIAEHHELMKKQGKRSDLAQDIEEDPENEESAPYQLSKRQINNYVRIDQALNDDLKNHLDGGKLSMKAAAELALIGEEESQEAIAEYIDEGGKVTEAKAKRLKEEAVENILTSRIIDNVVNTKKDKKMKVTIPDKMITSLFLNMTKDEILELIEVAVEAYNEQ